MVNCNGGFSDPGVIILTAVSCCHLLYFAFDKVQQNEDKIAKIKKKHLTQLCAMALLDNLQSIILK